MLSSTVEHDERWKARYADIPRLVHSALEKFKATDVPGLIELGFWVSDARVTTALPYVIERLYGRGQIVVFWGFPGAGKSFVAAEMLLCIGAGVGWRGRRVHAGICIYVVAESSRPFVENRIAALKRERPELASSRVLVVPLALDLLHAQAGDVDRVIAAAKELGEVAVIAVDTLSVTFGGGDENGPDMGQYVMNIKRIVQETGAAVLLIHHCGKDQARGMRGHSALLGALDAELAIEGDVDGGQRILRTGKVRDGEAYADLFAFALRKVELGADADGDAVTTCVVESTDERGTQEARRKRKGAGLGKHQKAVLHTLETLGGRAERSVLAHRLRDEGMPRNRVYTPSAVSSTPAF